MSQNINLWVELAMQQSPILSESAAELLYFRAASAWGAGYELSIPDGTGGIIDLTKLYEQFKILDLLKANYK